MKISKNWLNDYIDIDSYSDAEIANALAKNGIEVENYYNLTNVRNIIVAQVTTVKDHPNADKLKVCTVNIGNNIEKQVVCGASNVSEYTKVAYAPIGSIINGTEINEIEIRGVMSYGMLCSLEELGIDEAVVEERLVDGIIHLPSKSPLGADVIEVLKLNDTVFELDLTPDRSDCLSVIGLAYAISAIFNLEFKTTKLNYPDVSSDKKLVDLLVSDERVQYFSLIPIHKVKVEDSPEFIKARLIACGIKPINNIVDITNYVLLETGQPLHAFDLKKSGTNIEVRKAFKNEKLELLNGETIELSSADLVVSNQEQALSLAGIMGGFNSRVTKFTDDILLECAIFDSQTIRNSAKVYDLKTDSSTRYEKGLDVNRSEIAMKMAMSLLVTHARAKFSVSPVVYKNFMFDDSYITLKYSKLVQYIGFKIPVDDVAAILKRLKLSFKYENQEFKVKKLSRRLDINDDVDVIDEIIKLYGIDNISSTLPKLESSYSQTANDLESYVVKNALISMGYTETINYTLTNEQTAAIALTKHQTLIELLNPISNDRKYMRSSLIPSLVKTAKYNIERQQTNLKLYEISNVTYLEKNDYIEVRKLAGIISGDMFDVPIFDLNLKNDFYVAKGTVEKLFSMGNLQVGIDYDIVATEDLPSIFHPYQSATIIKDNVVVGYVGKIHPTLSKYDLYAFELDFKAINSILSLDTKITKTPQFPHMRRDLSVLVPLSCLVIDIIKEIDKVDLEFLENLAIYNVYTDEKLGNNKSVTLRFTFRSLDKTLSEEDIKPAIDRSLEVIKVRFGGKLR